jgi:phage terminase small subunit
MTDSTLKRPRKTPAKRSTVKRQPTPAMLPAAPGQDPLEFLLSVQNDPNAAPALRVRAAVAAAQYMHTRRADGGKKEEQEARAIELMQGGKFALSRPPLKLVSGG